MPLHPTPSNYRGATPYLIVSGASAAIEFYKVALGATEQVRLAEPSGKIAHAELRVGEAPVMLADEYPDMGYKSPSSLGGSPVSMLLYVEDVDQQFARALKAGAKELMAVTDQFDGDRRGTVVDPFGHIWLLATKKEEVSYEEMRHRFDRIVGGGGA